LSELSEGKMCFDMKLSCIVSASLIFFISLPQQSSAQQSPDSILFNESVSRVHQVYMGEIEDNAAIYHGEEYIRNGLKANGFPFFEANQKLTGWISYQGTTYVNQGLHYDMVTDEVIIPSYAGNALIALATEKVDSFSISGHVFISLKANASNHLSKDGYYEELYAGEPGVYARKEKRFVTGSGSDESKYVQYNSYLIRYKNVYYVVDSKNSLLEILKDREDSMKKFIRGNKLNFKRNFESALVSSVTYYSQLMN
jgi:hypothetical protein